MLEELLTFRKLITPVIIQILFWIGTVLCVTGGLVTMIASFGVLGGGVSGFIYGFLIMIVGPVLVRVFCELILLLFRINDSLNEIKAGLERRTS